MGTIDNTFVTESQNASSAANDKNSYEYNTYNSTLSLKAYIYGLDVFKAYKPEQIQDIINHPMENNQILRELSTILYGCNGVYRNTVDYMTALPTLDHVVIENSPSERKRKKNIEKMNTTLKSIRHKQFIRDALRKGMVEGVAFYYFETAKRPLSNKKIYTDFEVERIVEINEMDENINIISLPSDYTKIIGKQNNRYVLAFDLDYFNSYTGEDLESKLRKYPKEIREAYSREGYHGRWCKLDVNKTIVHKISSFSEEQWGRPLVLAAISDILYGDYFTNTKRNVLDEINNRIIYQTFPEGKEKGMSALTKTQQENQHESVKSAVMNKNNRGGISFFSVAAGTKINSIESSNTDIFDDKYESNLGDKVATDLGIASSLLNGTGSGNYSAQENNLRLVSAQVFEWIDNIVDELNKCINANIIKDKKSYVQCVYLPTTYANRKDIIQNAKDLYLQGSGSLSLWISACGISPEVYFALLDYEKMEDIENKYPVHQTSFTLSPKSNDNKAGRPEAEDSTNPSTLQTRASGSNNQPKPSTS